MTEYRIEELATVTGTTVRTLQSYRNKGLLPPPRRQGRIALYSDDHVARLIDLGVLTPTDEPFDGPIEDQPHHVELPAMLAAGTALTNAGIPLEAVLEEGFRLREDARVIARRFVELAVRHVIDEGAITPGSPATSVTELVQELVPHAPTVVAELVEVALRDSIHDEIARQIGHLLTPEDGAPEDPTDGE